MTSELWIGTTDAIHNLEAEWGDQIPEVIVQWWSHERLDEEGKPKEVERLEAHQLKDGSFMHLTYRGVSEMGEFDGSLVEIKYYVPEGTFRPYGGKERKSYKIYSVRHNKKDDKSQAIPGISLDRPDSRKDEVNEWSLDLTGGSNFSGTTILNGFQQIESFHMGEIVTKKADYSKAYRFTPLPEQPAVELITSGKAEDVYKNALVELPREKRAVVESLLPRVQAVMTDLAPVVRDFLATGAYAHETLSMAIDGILHHPEKIAIFDKKLSELNREHRFNLAQGIAIAIKQGKLAEWMKELQNGRAQMILADAINRNTYHLLDWFARTAPASANLSEWVGEVEKVLEARKNGVKAESTVEYIKCFDGMCTTYVERFIEFIVQQMQGNTLL